MAYSETVSSTTFNTQTLIETAFQRCKLSAEKITPEMQNIALNALYLLLSELANVPKAPSWCIEKVLLPMELNNQIVELPVGTVEVMNLNYRTIQFVTGTVTTPTGYYVIEFDSSTLVSTVGAVWNPSSGDNLTIQVSDDGSSWTTVQTIYGDTTKNKTVTSWVDITGAIPHTYLRVVVPSGVISLTEVLTGNTPSEIPLGVQNRDQYVNQNNQIFAGRPTIYWFQRDLPLPVVNIWPAPNEAATIAQLVLWRHRHIMDVGTLRQSVEVPQRWLNAIVLNLACELALSVPEIDLAIEALLAPKAAIALQKAWDGDNDGSAIQIQPGIAPYTR